MNETISTIVRAALKVGGGFLIAKGLATDAQVVELAGAVTTVIGFVWGVLAANKAAANNGK